MKTLVNSFTTQLKDALSIGSTANLTEFNGTIDNVLITGLGGSGIGGKIVSQLVNGEIQVPIVINNDYHIPSFVGANTLVIVSSFSGNTEETLAALKNAELKNAEIACITSGGALLEIAQAKNYNHIVLPECHSPRAMLSYSLTQQFFVFNHYQLIGDSFIKSISGAIQLLDTFVEDIKSEAKNVAQSILNKTAIIYSDAAYEGVCIRFRQQLNENAKALCWHHVLPEMNHNELVGWAGGNEEMAVILFRNESDFEKTQLRMDIAKGVIKKYTNTFIEVFSKGSNDIERSLYLILFGDWVSIYLSELRGVDAIEIDVINFLKSELAK